MLPVVLDVGTNNEKLLKDPRYLGIKVIWLISANYFIQTINRHKSNIIMRPCLGPQERRMEGDEYIALIDEFMAAVKLRWPRALVQFEDFQSKYAIKLLQRSDFFC